MLGFPHGVSLLDGHECSKAVLRFIGYRYQRMVGVFARKTSKGIGGFDGLQSVSMNVMGIIYY